MNDWIIAALVLLATAVSSGLLLGLLTSGRWRVARRLREISPDDIAVSAGPSTPDAQDHMPLVSSLLERAGFQQTLTYQLERAGLSWKPGEFFTAWVLTALALGGIGWFFNGPLTGLTLCIVVLAGGWLLLKMLQSRRLQQFEEQLPDALSLMASSLRSGYGFLRSLQAIRDEMPPPISVEFARVLDETGVGSSIPEALAHLLQRVPLSDLDIAVTAVLIQLDVGGNMAEILEIVAGTIRERQRIRAEVKTLTAEGRISGIILFFLPLGIGLMILTLNPSYMNPLFRTPLGQLIMFGAATLQVVGGIVMKRMLEVEF